MKRLTPEDFRRAKQQDRTLFWLFGVFLPVAWIVVCILLFLCLFLYTATGNNARCPYCGNGMDLAPHLLGPAYRDTYIGCSDCGIPTPVRDLR